MSSSFGSPSAMHGVHNPNAASPTTPAAHVVGTAGSPNHTVLTRNEVGGGSSSHTSPGATFQRHQHVVNDPSTQHAHPQYHQQHYAQQQQQQQPSARQHPEVVEILDSDSDTNTQPKETNYIQRLQPPFDPIPRSSGPSNGSSLTSKPTTHRASATPSIASLINDDGPPVKKAKSTNPSPTSGVFLDVNVPAPAAAPKKSEKGKKLEAPDGSPKSKSATVSTVPSPKPARQSAPTSSGGGLLGGVFTGGSGSTSDDFAMPNIYIEVPLHGQQNQYINFAKLAQEKYGWAALNPRAAKQNMAVDSGDEMMVDGSESESNVEPAGAGESTGGGADPKKARSKRKYQDVYDKDDPFIDDSEMLWEQQAAASKDGFFVYSGPLIPEGEKAQIERADGTIRRGRGRGRGSRGGATSTRGTGTTARKPRITKKEKEKLEREKEEREKFALMAVQQAKAMPR
ncbi:hypothetical protein FPQ18DRAFT_337805 [Pyronema domesticum]|uniref:Similar to Histone promoter control protein 2 acc. no. O43083 n=1 Tax=Pyronema omphalodes (strain CBS 100304) TaxID=1076935 RepID=U4LH05_PYROM|nr:hypothetical protein FPQ18DRAFT_337805 [Pyronema domesticum]CCX15598.1 Similar to Histone promoter control protein 2; acc. no. O43083 [Pyronema omphalodes CBS 100304]